MAQQRSFQKYVSKHHENDLFDDVASFIPDNLNEIHLWSYNIDVDNLDEENISFDDMKVEQVFVNGDTLTNDIEFDVLVSGANYFNKCDRHNDYEDSCNAWFRVNCRATIDGELKNFKVHDVEAYDKKKNRFHRRLSNALVPIISSEDVEFEAEQFLTLYFPEAMEIPQRIDPLLIAEKMGLAVEYHEISEDGLIEKNMAPTDWMEIQVGKLLVYYNISSGGYLRPSYIARLTTLLRNLLSDYIKIEGTQFTPIEFLLLTQYTKKISEVSPNGDILENLLKIEKLSRICATSNKEQRNQILLNLLSIIKKRVFIMIYNVIKKF
ncbi:hypothetical protein LAX80_005110 [Listeria marthii]|nr:hypothetical protein LAX80_005110 [Listeria marthii]